MLTTIQSSLEKENTVLTKVRISYSGTEERVFEENNLNDKQIVHFLKEELGDKVFKFMASYVNVNDDQVRYLYLVSSFSVNTLPLKAYRGIVNICKINYNHHIDKTFEAINKKLDFGGYYVGCADTYRTRKVETQKKWGHFAKVVIFKDFAWHRVFPKFSAWTKKVYLKLSGNHNLLMSQTEILGRLCRAGFDVVEYQNIDNRFWYVVKKIGTAQTTPAADYGMFYKKRCVGKEGKTLDVLKIRTMHPYAEYLQQYLIRKHGYSNLMNGKIQNDFRVTTWGRIMRKLYIDEIPQLWNVLKGEMALVGVRPIRRARLSEFPENLVKERQKYKPGCIPPYIALKMSDEMGNMQAEWIYLKEKQKYGFWTDVKYLFLGLYNLISGELWSA